MLTRKTLSLDHFDDPLVETRRHAAAGRNRQKPIGVPRSVDQSLDQRHVAGDFGELPPALGRLVARAALEPVVRLDAHLDERDARVVPRHVAKLIVEKLGVVLAVFRHKLVVGLRHAHLLGDRILMKPLAALNPARGLEVDAGMGVEVFEVAPPVAQKQRDAIVRAGNDQRNFSGRKPHQPVAAQGIAQQNGVVLRLVDGSQRLAKPGRHAHRTDVVQTLRQELGVDLVDRSGDGRAELAVENFASDEFQTQVGILHEGVEADGIFQYDPVFTPACPDGGSVELQSPGSRHSERSEESPWYRVSSLGPRRFFAALRMTAFPIYPKKCDFAILLDGGRCGGLPTGEVCVIIP